MFSLVNYRKGYRVLIAAVVLLASLLSIFMVARTEEHGH